MTRDFPGFEYRIEKQYMVQPPTNPVRDLPPSGTPTG